MLMRIKSDMELAYVYTIKTNYHSRTRLPEYRKVIDGKTPATMRLQGGKGNVQYSQEWIDYFIHVLNFGNPLAPKYFFHANSGVQNSKIRGRVEELTCEGNIVEVIKTDGNKNYLNTFHENDTPPSACDLTDPRIQRFTIVTFGDQLEDTPKGKIYFPLMARKNEKLWIDSIYLTSLNVLPKLVTVRAAPWLNIHASAGQIGLDGWIAGYPDGTLITISEIKNLGNDVWGKTDKGWVALKVNGQLFTDWIL